MNDVLRYAAFTTDPTAGNPAGVVLDAFGLSDEDMRSIASEVGYSETAFVLPQPADDGHGDDTGAVRSYAVRYFSPEIEVPFCGHATIATAVAIAEREGRPGLLAFTTKAGRIVVETGHDADGPATGAAAAAFGGYLRSLGLVTPPVTLRLRQGEDMGRPGLLVVDVPADADHVLVTGNAVALPSP